jgi:hypothetical protein
MCQIDLNKSANKSKIGLLNLFLKTAKSYFKQFEQPYCVQKVISVKIRRKKDSLNIKKSEIETQHIKRFNGILVT